MKKTNKRFKRRCVGCGQYFSKSTLHRLYIDENNQIFLDKNMNQGFRGAYVCNNDECIKLALKSKGFNKSFHKNIDSNKLLELFE